MSYEEKVIAVYERQSTLWKNANALYVSQDWVKAECLLQDFSKMREDCKEYKIQIKRGNEDVTEEYLSSRFVIRLTNKRGNNTKDFGFSSREEANDFFLREILHNKVLNGWKRTK